jgi:heterodisulfide reductase subunit A
MTEKVGAVLVVGGGIAGIQASLDLADSGFKVYMLEKQPSIGGVMTQLDKTFPTNDCAMCILAPKLVGAGRHNNIELITYSTLDSVEGEEGHFRVTLNRRASRVDPEKCTGCGDCAQKCPISAIDEYNEGFSERRSVYIRFPQAMPLTYTIDRDRCIGCGICSEICKAGAILYEEEDTQTVLDVGSIILTPGFESFDANILGEYGYGRFPNVVSSIEFERILSATGPYGGTVLRPSDGRLPKKLAFIQCVGSRDERVDNPYCSSVCCMYAIKEAIIAEEHNLGLEPTIFFMDIRAFGKEFDEYYERSREEHGVRFVRCRVSHLDEEPNTHDLLVTYDEDDVVHRERFDMVVLSVGMKPPLDAEGLAETLGIGLNPHGFCETGLFTPIETTRPGVYVCGAFSSPKDIPDSVAQASGAAMKAARPIASVRDALVTPVEYPSERQIEGLEPRIGVFVCHCGINIGGVVDVPAVLEYARSLPNVTYAERNLYTCSQDTQEKIREKILEYELNRVVVASCTPRTHEPLFRETLQNAGLNPYLFEMANIRDQCSWVHMHEPEAATEKAKDLVRMAVAKARLLKPLKKPKVEVTPVALVIGGGLSGMTAALEIAEQGYEVHLVEKEGELGGNLRRIMYTLEGTDPQESLRELVSRVEGNENIKLHLGTRVEDAQGYVGNFETTLIKGAREEVVKHGVVIIATGGVEYTPTEYLYGVDDNVMTQLELEGRLAGRDFNPKSIVMIQCVGSRCEERPNCSRICCSNAVKNALKILEVNSNAVVFILYKDMRTYGFNEDYYREAARKGVVFIRYEDDRKPEVSNDGGLEVSVIDPVLRERVVVEPDTLVLSAGVLPAPDNPRISGLFKLPLSKDGFFLEAHMKLRPLDFATDGVFLCGMAHSPKPIDESISQACGAAARAMTILSRPIIEVEGAIAVVNEELCSGCRMCEGVCEFNAIEMIEEDGKVHSHVIEEVCKGCGVCVSTCPSGAITAGHFTDDEILAQVRAALVEART